MRYATAGTPDACVDDNRAGYGDTENVMCDVIKIRLRSKDERKNEKETSKKEMNLDVFL